MKSNRDASARESRDPSFPDKYEWTSLVSLRADDNAGGRCGLAEHGGSGAGGANVTHTFSRPSGARAQRNQGPPVEATDV